MLFDWIEELTKNSIDSEMAQKGISVWIGGNSILPQQYLPNAVDAVKRMYFGNKSAGLKAIGIEGICTWHMQKSYRDQCIKQRAGCIAEVISITKEELIALRDKTGIVTKRTDELPELFMKDNEYFDKVRLDSKSNIAERIRTKFAGKNPKECLAKLKSCNFEKYIMNDCIDKVEIPKDYYDDVKAMAIKKIESLEKQMQYLKVRGREDIFLIRKKEYDQLKAVNQKIEQSTVTRKEAIDAAEDPKQYLREIFMN